MFWTSNTSHNFDLTSRADFFLGEFFTILDLNDGRYGHINVACDFVPLHILPPCAAFSAPQNLSFM